MREWREWRERDARKAELIVTDEELLEPSCRPSGPARKFVGGHAALGFVLGPGMSMRSTSARRSVRVKVQSNGVASRL
jgi:hypothetical protein